MTPTQTIVKALVTYKTFMKVRIETLNIDGKCVTDPQDRAEALNYYFFNFFYK